MVAQIKTTQEITAGAHQLTAGDMKKFLENVGDAIVLNISVAHGIDNRETDMVTIAVTTDDIHYDSSSYR